MKFKQHGEMHGRNYKSMLNGIKEKGALKYSNYTCTDIDNIITTLNQLHEGTKKLTKLRLQVLERKLERLRNSNEALRDSGIYGTVYVKRY
ncbi:MAG: hypothetical protein CM15mV25_0020 [uncultured marine virus]|nr:MAG: hypothetical protein CM15mV25_0020 [uncultured marine virus]